MPNEYGYSIIAHIFLYLCEASLLVWSKTIPTHENLVEGGKIEFKYCQTNMPVG